MNFNFSEKAFRLFCLVIFIPVALFAQHPTEGGRRTGDPSSMNIGRFYGKVIDEETGKGLAYASVQLIGMRFDTVEKKPVQAVMGGQLTEENGEFSLENLPVRGEFTLKINYLGYATHEQKISFGVRGGKPEQNGERGRGSMGQAAAGAFDKDLGNIRLAASSQMLKEVTVRGEASQVSLALDKKVYKVDKDNSAAGGTAEDALKNIPTLNVDIDGNLTLRNAAPQLFIDGRPSPLSLDQIPADAIDNVEVITNPSAKYDASGGGSGIVNIVLKKERRIGYNGSVRAGIDSRLRPNLGADLNAREGKINAFLGGNLNLRKNLVTGGTDRYNLFGLPRTNVFQTNDGVNTGYFASLRGGVDWFLTNRSTLTLGANYHGGVFNNDDLIDIQTDTLGAGSLKTNRDSDSDRSFGNLGAQMLFKHIFPKEGKEWTADVNLNSARSDNEALFVNTFDRGLPEQRQKQTGDGLNRFYTFQTDFVNPINKEMKYETGLRAAIREYDSNNANLVQDSLSGNFIRVPNFADVYGFTDQVYAAYFSFNHAFMRWGYQAGLRAESSRYKGVLPESDTSFSNEFPLSLFPSLFVTYKIDETDNLQLSATRRINRPSFFQLLPYTDFSDPLILQRGNPGLIPEFNYSLEFNYQNIINKNNNFLWSVYYKYNDNLISRYQFSEYSAELGRDVIVSSFANSNFSSAYGSEFTLKNVFWKILDLTTNLNLYQSEVNAQNVESGLRAEQFTVLLKENLSLKLPREFTLQLNGTWQSRAAYGTEGGGGGGRGSGRGGMGGGGGWGGGPTSTAQGYTIPFWFVDVSIRKDFWKKTASITLAMQDVFRTRKTGSHTESPGIFVQDTWRLRDPQIVRLNLSFRFGKFDVSLFKRKNTRSDEGMDMGF